MRKLVFAVALLAMTAGLTWAASHTAEVEVRISARELEDGQIEFSLQQRDGAGWSDDILPRQRLFPADPGHGRWLRSSAVTVTVDMPIDEDGPTMADAGLSEQLSHADQAIDGCQPLANRTSGHDAAGDFDGRFLSEIAISELNSMLTACHQAVNPYLDEIRAAEADGSITEQELRRLETPWSYVWKFAAETVALQKDAAGDSASDRSSVGDAWSSETTAELAVRPEDWTPPSRAVTETTRWGWAHAYDADTGEAYVLGPMNRRDGQSPTQNTRVILSVQCSPDGVLHLGLTSDAAMLDGQHAVVWWTDNSEYRRAELWNAEALSPDSDLFYASAPAPSALWAEIRDSSKLHVLIFGERSWHSADVNVARISQLAVVEILDYCGQSAEPEAEE